MGSKPLLIPPHPPAPFSSPKEGAEKVPVEEIFERGNKNIVFVVAALPPQKQFFFYPFPPARRDCLPFLSSLQNGGGYGGEKEGFEAGGEAARLKPFSTPPSPLPLRGAERGN